MGATGGFERPLTGQSTTAKPKRRKTSTSRELGWSRLTARRVESAYRLDGVPTQRRRSMPTTVDRRYARPGKPVAVVTSSIPRTLDLFHREMIRQLKAQGYDVCVVSTRDPWLDRIAQGQGVRVRALDMTRTISVGADLVALAKWLRVLCRERPELIVSQTPKASLLSQVAGKMYGVPRRLYFVGGLRLEGAQGKRRVLLSVMERITVWAATETVVNSTSLAQRYHDLRLAPSAKVRQTYPGSSHGVDAEHFRPQVPDPWLAEELGLEIGVPVIGFVGRLTRDKGIDTLLDAVSRLGAAGTPVQLLVVGPQDEVDSAGYLQRLRATDSRVVTVDWVDDVRPYMALMNVHVLPSIREGFPNVVLEAGAMGIPTVTTDATGAVDSVRHGETGLVVRTGDAEAMAEAVATLLADPETARRYGEAAREWVSTSFHPVQVVKSLLAFME